MTTCAIEEDAKIAIYKDNDFVEAEINDLADPKSIPFLMLEVGNGRFNEHATFDYYKDAKRWWIDGMGKCVASSILLIEDQRCKGEIYIFYHYLSDSECMFLGKMHETCGLYKVAIEKFKNFRM